MTYADETDAEISTSESGSPVRGLAVRPLTPKAAPPHTRTPTCKSAHQQQATNKLTIHPTNNLHPPAPDRPPENRDPSRPVTGHPRGAYLTTTAPAGSAKSGARRQATTGETAVGCAVRPCSRNTSFPVSPGRKAGKRTAPPPRARPMGRSVPRFPAPPAIRSRGTAVARPRERHPHGPPPSRLSLERTLPAILRGAAPTSVLAVFVSGFHSISPCEASYARQRRSRTASPSAGVCGLASLSGLR